MTLDDPSVKVVVAQPKLNDLPNEILSKYVEMVNRAFTSKSHAHDQLFGDTPRLTGAKDLLGDIADGHLFVAYTTKDLNSFKSEFIPSELLIEPNRYFPPESATVLGIMGLVKNYQESLNSPTPYYTLRIVAVNPDLWRGGIGAKLLNVLEKYLASVVESKRPSILIAECVREVGNDEYYKRRGFVFKSEKPSEPNQWGSQRKFTVIRMEKVVQQ